MDDFKKWGEVEQCIGGRKCKHCSSGHNKDGSVDKTLNRRARARLKAENRKLIDIELNDI